ncbi:selT-like protein isoform X2 [Arabidopsis lyrata subsp. lyrata]|uniref:selT-like protein isoform X2 n=1 Tax=Arabidopsis lyrata subsp. lyrata TaxID=81972 RepID=UPI000A29BAB8|nr:selT-like protein isoform X2 [Arabidopsis lyrata subsp. lyrata]|eukprot:XP_020881343.1 selT-like protein isoform X2 [Arabidopsis lyrata subsp. lyrata]
MDKTQLILLGLPIFLLFTDLLNLFTPPPPKSQQQPPPSISNPQRFPETLKSSGVGYGNTVEINFCVSCSYKGTAVTMKKMLETAFPGLDVVLANYPAPAPKRILAKVVPVAQMGVIGLIMGGEQIFSMIGIAQPPAWYHSLRANRFGSMASTWLLGNFLQSFLQSSGAFEVSCNGELVFSKLKEGRFPGEIELRDLIRGTLTKPFVAGSY